MKGIEVISLVLCENIVFDAGLPRNLEDLCVILKAPAFPATSQRLYAYYVVMTQGNGQFKIQAQINNNDDPPNVNPVVSAKPENVTFISPSECKEMVATFHNCKFNKPGAYRLDILLNDSILKSLKFNLAQRL